MDSVMIDGQKVKVGNWVCFKSDIEQSGEVTKIAMNCGVPSLCLKDDSGFEGEYLRGQTVITVQASECWVE